ncbi:hypothetical protein Rsub_01391 [Raphidocelis subcapitata]|uniref:Uncharacterized protein n=1 Tax=Raphidocelis subcapitata TaxID=307507 RepID=A0A2V0NQK7_9CHLO|nr:hypothetical protein Rsub_01391 [Raphidocelis subcapitata]|eukprot:GBF88892.1 hypothetical protein Rsub_01391 [Raphidocelis subcapitata]
MFGDMDLIHSAAARAPPPPNAAPAAQGPAAPGAGNPFSRFSLDSSLSGGSTGSASLSSSWSPRATFLSRPPPSASSGAAGLDAPGSSPIAIPGARGAAAAAALAAGGAGGGENFLRRHSMAGPYAASASAAGAGAGGAAAASSGAGASAGASAGHRFPALARSLSKGLSQSMDFR